MNRITIDCNLELRLNTAPSSDYSVGSTDTANTRLETNDRQKLTIFYSGMVSVCDVTEMQARAIILHASRESRSPVKESPVSSTQVYGTTAAPGLSMKRSLQKFLQKRTHRLQATAPYNINRCLRDHDQNSVTFSSF